MASIYRRKDSKYWWVKWFDASGRVRQESTGLRIDSVAETREARRLRAQREAEELRAPREDRNQKLLDRWVPRWLGTRFAKQPNTLESYLGAWNHLFGFFKSRDLLIADRIRREHCFEYLEKRIKAASRNTAIHDLAILRLILNEAVRRNWIDKNPASALRLKKDIPSERPEITEAERILIEKALKKKPDWMKVSWAIAWHQGCRLAETSVPLKDVDLKNRMITFTIKGGRRHTTRLHPDLVPLFNRLKREKKKVTWDFRRSASRDWSRFFKKIGLGHLTFHSTRVTVITRLARSGTVNEQMAMRFIGHCSSEIHAIYQRLQAVDLDGCLDALKA